MSERVVRFVKAAVGPDPGGPADADLLRRFAATRDAGAFELLVWRHSGMVLATCRAVLRDRHLAEDASQAAFLALAKQAGRVRDNPAGWLYRVARRAATRMRRAGSVSDRSAGGGLPAQSQGGLRSLTLPARQDFDDADVLHAELARLPDKYRLPVLLCFVEGLSHADAADRLGWPVGTVAGRLSRAKDRLRTRLTARGLAPSMAALAVAGTDGPFAAATARLGVAFAAGNPAGVAPAVLTLTHGAMRAMTYAKLKLAAGLVAACGAITAGGVWAGGQKPAQPPDYRQIAPPPPDRRPGPQAASPAQRRRSLANLERIAKAIKDYEATWNHYPADLHGPDGKPLLSWRVAILPQLGRDDLYRRFKLDEPWDSKANLELLASLPQEYVAGVEPLVPAETYYQVFAGPGSAFEPGRRVRIPSITDGTNNTLGVVEAGPPVPWTKPADLPFDPDKPFPKVAWPFSNVVNVANLTGEAFPLDPSRLDDRLWKVWVGRNDGQVAAGMDGLRLESPAETEAEKRQLKRLQDENDALILQLIVGWTKTAAVLKAGNTQTRDPILARRLNDLLKNMVRSIEQSQQWLPEQVGAKPAVPPAKK